MSYINLRNRKVNKLITIKKNKINLKSIIKAEIKLTLKSGIKFKVQSGECVFSLTTMSNKLDVKLMLQIIPEYDGNPYELHKFLTCCGIIYDPLTVIDDRVLFMKIINSKLTHSAYELVKYREFVSYTELVDALKKQFSCQRTRSQINQDMSACVQGPTEKVIEFSNKIEKLLMELDLASSTSGEVLHKSVKKINDDNALNFFINGLRGPYSIIVRASRPTNLRDAINFAIDEELRLPQSNTLKNQIICHFCNKIGHVMNDCRLRRVCSRCHKSGHFARDCKVNTNFNNNNYSNNNYNRINSHHNNNSQNNNTHNNVMNKNVSNGIRYSSVDASVVCNYCKNKGHILRDCRKRKYNNDRANEFNNRGNELVQKVTSATVPARHIQ